MDELSASRRGVGSAVLVVSALVVLLAVGLTAASMPQAVHLQTAASASAGTVRPGRSASRSTATTAAPTTSVTTTTVAPTTSTAAPTPASLASERATLHAAVATSTTVVHRPVATTPTTRPVVATTVPVTAPPATVPPSAAAVLACIRQRESGGNYAAVSANGVYRGAYQFSQATWDGAARLAGRPDLVGVPPNLVSPANQDAVALAEYEAAGLAPWGGHCP